MSEFDIFLRTMLLVGVVVYCYAMHQEYNKAVANPPMFTARRVMATQ